MKFAVSALVTLFFTNFVVFAQSDNREIDNLRQQINVSDKEIIVINKDAKLPAGNPLKVFLAVKRDADEAQYFEKWIEEWNRKDGSQYGKLELVKDISKADVVLTQFIMNRGKYVEEASINVGNIPPPGQIISPGKVKTKVTVNGEKSYKSLTRPVYSYLIKRENSIWTIIYQDVETSLTGEQLFNPELALWQAFKNEIKLR